MGTIEVPIFYGEGDELMEWVCWINDFCYDQGFSDSETLRFAYGFIEGEALDWYHEESSRSVFKSWANLKYRLVMRFSERPTQLEVTNRQEQLRQIGRMLDRWDEEDQAKKQLKEEAGAAGDLNQILSSVEGFVKSFELIPPATKTEKTNGLIETHVVLSDSISFVGICEESAEDEASLVSMEGLYMGHKWNVRKKKTRWKSRLVADKKGFEKGLLSDRKEHVGREGQFSEFVDSTGLRKQRNGGKEAKAESYAYQLLDEMHLRKKGVKMKNKKRKRWKEVEKKITELKRNIKACIRPSKNGDHMVSLWKTKVMVVRKVNKLVLILAKLLEDHVKVFKKLAKLLGKYVKFSPKVARCKKLRFYGTGKLMQLIDPEKLMQKRKRVLKKLGKMEDNGIKHGSQLLCDRPRLENLKSDRETTGDRSAQNLQGEMTRELCNNFTMLLKNQHNITKAVKKLKRVDSNVELQEQRYDKSVQIIVAEALYISLVVLAAVKLGGTNQLLVTLLEHRNQRQCMSFASVRACSYSTDGYLLEEKQSSGCSNRVWKPGGLRVLNDKLDGLERTGKGQGSSVKREETISPQSLSSQEKDQLGTGRQTWSGDEALEWRLEDMWWLLKVKILLGAVRKRRLFKNLGPIFIQTLDILIKESASGVEAVHCSDAGFETRKSESPTNVWLRVKHRTGWKTEKTLVWQLQNRVKVFASVYLWSERFSTRKARGSLKKMKLGEFRLENCEHPPAAVRTHEVFHLQRPPEQFAGSWSAEQGSVVSSIWGRRLISLKGFTATRTENMNFTKTRDRVVKVGSFDQLDLEKIKEWCALELTNISYTAELNSGTSKVQWQKELALYLHVPTVVGVVEVVDETIYFTQETFPSPRPPELYQVESLCFLNREEINFPHDPGDNFLVKEVTITRALESLLRVYTVSGAVIEEGERRSRQDN